MHLRDGKDLQHLDHGNKHMHLDARCKQDQVKQYAERDPAQDVVIDLANDVVPAAAEMADSQVGTNKGA